MTVYILNLADLCFTLYALSIGIKELNPFMQSVPFMVFYKTVVVGAACWVLYWAQAKKPICICTAVYAAVNLYHILGVILCLA